MKEIQEALVWTTEPPTEPGWYWVKDQSNHSFSRVTVLRWSEGELHDSYNTWSRVEFSHFAGPIPEPQEEK
jgi:hypothetical protein